MALRVSLENEKTHKWRASLHCFSLSPSYKCMAITVVEESEREHSKEQSWKDVADRRVRPMSFSINSQIASKLERFAVLRVLSFAFGLRLYSMIGFFERSTKRMVYLDFVCDAAERLNSYF